MICFMKIMLSIDIIYTWKSTQQSFTVLSSVAAASSTSRSKRISPSYASAAAEIVSANSIAISLSLYAQPVVVENENMISVV